MARTVVGLMFAGLIGLAGFAAVPAHAEDDWVVLTSEDLEGLEKVPHDRFDKLYVRSGVDLSSFKAVNLDEPVEFAIRDPAVDDALRFSDRTVLSRYLWQALESALGDALVDDGGEGILVLQVYITDISPNSDVTGEFPADPRDTRSRSIMGRGRTVGLGRISGEMVLINAANGEIVAAIGDTYRGIVWKDNPNLHTRWGDARDGLRLWARGIADLIE